MHELPSAILFLLCFVFSEGQGQGQEESTGTGKTTIQVWLRGSSQYLDAYNEMGKMFMAKYPDITVEFTLIADLEDKLITSMIGGQAPDAWIMDTVTTGR